MFIAIGNAVRVTGRGSVAHIVVHHLFCTASLLSGVAIGFIEQSVTYGYTKEVKQTLRLAELTRKK